MSALIDALDSALEKVGESAKLRRPIGSGASQRFVAVDCMMRITALRDDQISAGITQTELNFIMSPSEINRAQWPGGTVPQLPPFDIDQRVPRAQADQIVARGKVRTVTFADPVFIGDEMVRINGRMTG